jgi:hypothetical protein
MQGWLSILLLMRLAAGFGAGSVARSLMHIADSPPDCVRMRLPRTATAALVAATITVLALGLLPARLLDIASASVATIL